VQLYRIIRDTAIARRVKYLHNSKCQVCGDTIKLNTDVFYAEAHHIRPLGGKHKGPDVIENIICVCPNHHVLLDYGALKIDKLKLRLAEGHFIRDEYIDYHNDIICSDNKS